MNNLTIISGKIKLCVNGDESRVIEFNPNSLEFTEKFYELIEDFEKKVAESEKILTELEQDKSKNSLGIPTNTKASLALTRELCDYMCEKIDYLFGKGTSKAAFGDEMQLDMIEQFFNGITPYIAAARGKAVEKYTGAKNSRVMK